MYPNPTQNELFIKFKDTNKYEVKIEILNSNGQIMHIENRIIIGLQTKINLSKQITPLTKGIYFCKISSGTDSITKKIIKD